MSSRWTIYQFIVVLFLVILMLVAEMFKGNFSISFSSNGMLTFIPLLLTFLFIVIVVGCCSLIMIFQTKKSKIFLIHPIWMKMYLFTPLLIFLSIVFFVTMGLSSTNFQEFMQEQRWTLYVFICYFIFMMNLFVLSVIHKIKDKSISNEGKIKASYLWTSLILFVIIFMLP